MLTSKRRADLRSEANALETTLMVGKGGVTDSVIAEAATQLEARELVKGRVLEASMLTPDGGKIVARGECHGIILPAPLGENGFGYDPVFYVPEKGCTFAQLPAKEKNRISHRAKALEAFAKIVKEENFNADK